MLNPYQKILVDTYAAGEFAHITTVEEARKAGDTLFVFLFLELATAEDCDSADTALERLATAEGDIDVVHEALRAAAEGGLK